MDLYIARDKTTGKVLSGAKGQYAFSDVGTLRRSMVHSLRWETMIYDMKASEFYDIYRMNTALIDDVGLLEEVD